MVSFRQLICIMVLALVSIVICSEQEAVSVPLSEEEVVQFDKRRIDGHSRTSIPLFRGSNLGIFVRKRPFAAIPEHSMYRRKDSHSKATDGNHPHLSAEVFNNNEQHRRFDDYSENPGPMFGR